MVRRLRILDAGAGTGQVIQEIKALGIPVQIVALDRSASMLRELRSEHPEIPSVRGDMDRLPFADETFDMVMFGRSLHWGDPKRTPAEVWRVLRPGGALVSLGGSLRGGTAIARAVSTGLPSVVAENPMTSGATRGGPLNLGTGFLPNSPRRFEYHEHMTPGQLRDLLSSYAGLTRAPESVRAQVLARAEAFLARFGEAERLTVPVVTVVHVARADKPRLTPRARKKPRAAGK
jgi:SAM-dependent methyltransferase